MHNFVPLSQAMKIPDAKAVVKERDKLEKLLARQMTKVKSKKEVIWEARKEETTVHYATLTDFCHLKNAELEPKIPTLQRPEVTQ